MSVREYIGARYVPLFAEPLTWDATRTYEPLTVVLYQGNSYTSRQAVPANIDIHNTTYWAQTGNYNAQIEQYRAEVETFDTRITQNTGDISSLEGIIPSAEFSDQNTVKDYIDTVAQNIDNAVDDLSDLLPASNFTSTNTVKKYVDDTVDASTKLAGKKAIIYGDSTFIETTQGNSVLGTLIAEVTGMEIDNRAVSGTNLTHLINYLNNAAASDFNGYDFVFIAYGTNDWHNGKYLWDTYGTDRENTFQRQLNVAFDRLDTIRGTCKPVIVTPAYARRNDFTYAMDYVPNNLNNQGLTIESYVDVELLEANKRDYPCIDLYHTMGVSDANYQQLMMRSSYDPSSEHYNKWFHYSQTMKERIAQVFLKYYPYNVPAYPFDAGAQNNIIYQNSFEIPRTDQFGYIPLITAFGNPDSNSPITPYFLGKFTGDDTISFVAKTGGYCDVQIGTENIIRYPCRHSGYHNIRIKGVFGEKRVYIANLESNPATHGDPVFNVCLQHGNTAFPYALAIKEGCSGWNDFTALGFTSGTIAKTCINNGVCHLMLDGRVSAATGAGHVAGTNLPMYMFDRLVKYKQYPFYYALSSGGGWQIGMCYIETNDSGVVNLCINTPISAANSMVHMELTIPISTR